KGVPPSRVVMPVPVSSRGAWASGRPSAPASGSWQTGTGEILQLVQMVALSPVLTESLLSPAAASTVPSTTSRKSSKSTPFKQVVRVKPVPVTLYLPAVPFIESLMFLAAPATGGGTTTRARPALTETPPA